MQSRKQEFESMGDKIISSRSTLKGFGVFSKDCSGSTAIEYALIAAGISTAIFVSVTGVGSQVVSLFTTVSSSF
jgi:pilus assembly protein Flp/PilA